MDFHATGLISKKLKSVVIPNIFYLNLFLVLPVHFSGLNILSLFWFLLQKIGDGNFSCVFKAVKRIDGCMYAVKCSTRQLHKDAERLKNLFLD